MGVASIVGLGLEGASVAPVAAVGVVAVCYAVGPAMLPRWLAGLPSLGIIAVSLGLTAVAYVPITAVSGAGETPSLAAVGSILGLAVVCTAIAFLVFFALIGEIGPARATVITYVNPAVAAVLGVAILGEEFTVGMGIGFVLVLAGSVLATRPGRAATCRRARHSSRRPTSADVVLRLSRASDRRASAAVPRARSPRARPGSSVA